MAADKKAPANTFTQIEKNLSKKTSLKSKKYVILYFGNKHCPHCKQFKPQIVQFHKKWQKHSDKFTLIYVSESDGSADIRSVGSKLPFPYLKVSKKKISSLRKINENTGTPLIYIIDEDLILRGKGIAGRMLPQVDRVFTKEFK